MAEYHYISQHCRKLATQSIPLFRAALKDDWKAAEALLLEDASMLTAPLTINGETVLHVASLAGHADFVRKLVQMMSEKEMLTTNSQGHTALCFVARQGSVGTARLLLDKAPAMARVSGDARGTPLCRASVVGNREMAEFLFPKSGFDHWADAEKVDFLTTAIESRLYVLATWALEKDVSLAIVKNSRSHTPLQTLADNPIVSGCAHSSSDVQRLCELMVDGVIPQRDVGDQTTRRLAGLEAIKCVIFRAAKSGNAELLVELFRRFPDLICEDVEVGQGILTRITSSWVSMLTFLSTLTSYCIAIDLAFLPMQLVVGIISLGVSVLSLLISFFMTVELYDESVVQKILLCVAAIAPVLFATYGLLDIKIRYRASFRPTFRSGYRVAS